MPEERIHPSLSPNLGGTEQARSPQTQRRKRKRVSVACRSCRTRKSRCDGGQPCSTCLDTGTDCRYEQPDSQPAAVAATCDLQRQNTFLEQRLQAIEQKLESLGPVNPYVNEGYSSPPLERSMTSGQRPLEGHPATSAGNQGYQQQTSTADLTRPSEGDDGVDGMGAVALKEGADEEEYFGPSSNVAFLRLIVSAVRRPSNTGDTTVPPSVDVPTDPVHESASTFLRRPSSVDALGEHQRKTPVDPFALPSQTEADSLLRLYFTTVNLMVPCIHEDSFRQPYKQIWKDGIQHARRSWLALLNMIFAIATNVMTPTAPPYERATRSDMFFERAMALVRPNMMGRLSVEMVQLFLMSETYLEGTTSSSLAWTFHGLAVKGVYQLGVHSMASKNLSPVDREIRRRLWYWCAMTDRLLSVTYGRPPLIPLSHARLEACSYIAFSNVPSGVLTSSLAFFDAILSLTHIMGETVDRLYDQNLGFRVSAPWQDNLPAYLKIITSAETLDDAPLTLETTRVRVLLSLRYLGTSILVLRPVLSHFLDLPCMTTTNERQSEWLRKSGAMLLADLVRTCNDVFRISKNILTASRNDRNLLGAWWFSCYYTFNAALAVLGVLLIRRIPAYVEDLSAISATELRDMLNTAMEILHGLDRGNKTVMRCRDTLTRLLNAVDSDVNAAGFSPSSFPLPPPSAWAWLPMDPGLFGSEASLSFAPGTFDIAPTSHLSGGLSIQPDDSLQPQP